MMGPTPRRLVALMTSTWLLAAGLHAQTPRRRETSQTPTGARGLSAVPREVPPVTTPGDSSPSGLQPVRPATPAPSQQRGHGRLFQPQNLGMLEGPDREAWQRPDQIMIPSRTTRSQPIASTTNAKVDTETMLPPCAKSVPCRGARGGALG